MKTFKAAIFFSLFSFCACGGTLYSPSGTTSGDGNQPPPGSTPVSNANNFPTSGPTVRYVGRFDSSNPNGVQFAWSGSAITTNFHGTGISAGLIEEQDASYDGQSVNNFYDIYLDGNSTPTTIQATQDSTSYTLASGLSADTNHTLRLVKRTEAQLGAAMFTGFSVAGGNLLPAPLPSSRSIEFIGDSITCGYGVLESEPTATSCTFSDNTEDGDKSFAAVSATTLGADFTEIAFSGKGLMVNVDPSSDPTNTMPVLYPYSVPQYYTNYTFDTNSWNPQVVVINLGTNDYQSGETINASQFVETYEDFINKQIRNVYPSAQIFCLVGPVLDGNSLTSVETNVQQVVTDLNNSGDSAVHYLEFPHDTGTNGYGCDGHPDQVTQASMAASLVTAIKEATGWQ